VLSDDRLRERMAVLGRERARRRNLPEAMAEAMKARYREAAA
jgi:hypothetical protein